jgi:hypothetical protein
MVYSLVGIVPVGTVRLDEVYFYGQKNMEKQRTITLEYCKYVVRKLFSSRL